jgi:hypothetical protein
MTCPVEARARMYYFVKDRLPKGWSYPLGRGVLDAALESAGVTSVLFVRYMLYGGSTRGERSPWVLHVQSDPETSRSPGVGSVSITVYAVPSAERHATMVELRANLAAVCDWIKRGETASPSWRMTEHELAVEMRDHEARLVERHDR